MRITQEAQGQPKQAALLFDQTHSYLTILVLFCLHSLFQDVYYSLSRTIRKSDCYNDFQMSGHGICLILSMM